MFDVSSEHQLSLSQECWRSAAQSSDQCALVSMSLRDTLSVRGLERELLIARADLQDTLMTERGGEGWAQPVPDKLLCL